MSNEPKYGMRRDEDIERVVKKHAREIMNDLEDRSLKFVPFKARIYWRDSTGKEAIEVIGQTKDPQLILQDVFEGRSEHGEHSLNTILTEYGKASTPPNDHGLLEDRKPVAITISGQAVFVNKTVIDEHKQETSYAGYLVLLCAGRAENGMKYIELNWLDIDENQSCFVPDQDPPELKKRLRVAKATAIDFMSAFFRGFVSKGDSNFKFTEV